MMFSPSLFWLQSSSVSPSASFRTAEKHRNSTDYSSDSKKQKTEEKEIAARYVSKFLYYALSNLCVVSSDSWCTTHFKIDAQIFNWFLLLASSIYARWKVSVCRTDSVFGNISTADRWMKRTAHQLGWDLVDLHSSLAPLLSAVPLWMRIFILCPCSPMWKQGRILYVWQTVKEEPYRWLKYYNFITT